MSCLEAVLDDKRTIIYYLTSYNHPLDYSLYRFIFRSH